MTPVAFLEQSLLLGALLFGIGLIGFLVRRNVIVVLLSLEMMLQGVSISLVAWSRHWHDWSGQVLVVFVIVVAACEAGIALVLILMMSKQSGTLDIVFWQQVREPGSKPYVDKQLPEMHQRREEWPELTPAGVQPEADPKEQMYRSHV
jgi:NADH-quinone oxidoreductase subunit K